MYNTGRKSFNEDNIKEFVSPSLLKSVDVICWRFVDICLPQ